MIILLVGRKRAGKDTTAIYLSEEIKAKRDVNINFVSLADPIKDIVCNSLNLTRFELEYLKEHPEIDVDFNHLLWSIFRYLKTKKNVVTLASACVEANLTTA